jgi:hypothetical protein
MTRGKRPKQDNVILRCKSEHFPAVESHRAMSNYLFVAMPFRQEMSNRKGQVGFGFLVDGLYNAAAIGISDCIGGFFVGGRRRYRRGNIPDRLERGRTSYLSSFLIIFLYEWCCVHIFFCSYQHQRVYKYIPTARIYTYIFVSPFT